MKIHVPRAHEVQNQRVIAKRTSQIMKYGQDVIIQKRTDDILVLVTHYVATSSLVLRCSICGNCQTMFDN